jgi:hypothetical protein
LEEDARENDHEGEGAAGIGKPPAAEESRSVRVRPQLARRTGGAVLRILQLAAEIMVLERRNDEKQGVNTDAENPRPSPPAITSSATHVR